MLIRVATLVALLASLIGCTPDSDAAPPSGRNPSMAVAPGDVPAARWHAVLIAGDNNSPSFDNGIDALRDKLSARGVRDIRMLTSDPGRNPSAEVASAANVSSALRNAGGAGACLAFITSHGTEAGVVLRQANGVVRPSALDNALDAGCGTLPTVVIVSACHSGVFLTPAMRQPNRVVLTAAAADRVSFGCGAGDRFTYYDQCLLQQFDGATTWGQLAQATRSCVQNLEKSMGIRTPSLPQIFVGSSVANLRLPGR
ncbi:C13 family peptidase [Reyranella sp.]|uniref:C13 family peptidase n=1 Tax=Reyranella sp. TaxID=1929291 RepID=UPI003BACA33E